MLSIGAIEFCSPCKNQFISPYFLINKANGGKRLIFNLKKLNEFIVVPHFKLEDIRTVIKLISPGAFMAKIDLQDAYFLIPVRHQDRKFLRFSFQGKLFQYTCLPFGLSTSPHAFTKLMRPVVQHLRLKGLISAIYLDDILYIAPTFEECQINALETVRLLSSLGFVVNREKSCLTPLVRCEYLGFIVDSQKFCLELLQKK